MLVSTCAFLDFPIHLRDYLTVSLSFTAMGHSTTSKQAAEKEAAESKRLVFFTAEFYLVS